MGVTVCGIGKGLREPCSPYREVNIFGANLGVPDASNWNCLPSLISPTTNYDLSTIPKNTEVLVALINFSNVGGKDFTIHFGWYRSRDNKLVGEGSYRKGSVAWTWTFAYSYTGYLDGEIDENGQYYVDISVLGDVSYNKQISFTISGIKEEEPVPSPAADFVDTIFSIVWSISDWFESLYNSTKNIWLVGEPVSNIFLAIHDLFWRLLTPTAHFHDWVYTVEQKIRDILNIDEILDVLSQPISWAERAYSWVQNAWQNIWNTVTDWWSTVKPIILDWIEEAKTFLKPLIDNTNKWLSNLQQSWDDFWTQTFPTLADWAGTNNLIDSTLKSWFPWYDTLVSIKDEMFTFFADPQQYVYDKLDEFFERFW